MNDMNPSSSVAQIVTEHPECARVFQRYDIDFCCRGASPLRDVPGPRLPEILEALAQAIELSPGPPAIDVRRATVPELIDWIVVRHHGYTRRALAEIEPLAAKVTRVHGAHEPRLHDTLETFRALRSELEPHMDGEEQVLFPALRGDPSTATDVDGELRTMRDEHERVGELLARLRDRTDGYNPPAWGCGSYHSLMRQLELLDADILRHVHLENHVLATRVIEARRASAALRE